MIKVDILDVIKPDKYDAYCICLNDDRKRVLPIFVGPSEARAIALAKASKQTPRPMTYALVASILDTLEVKTKEIRIDSIKDSVFYAKIQLETPKGSKLIDGRPSDAIALAATTNAPILVSEELMDKVAMQFPRDAAEPVKRLVGMDQMIEEMEKHFSQKPTVPPQDPVEKQQYENAFNHHINRLLEGRSN